MRRTASPAAPGLPGVAARRLVPALLFALGLLQTWPVMALGVGTAELRSRLGEPLDVRVPIRLDGNEPAGELRARLLPFAAYAPLGLEAPRLDPGSISVKLVSEGDETWLSLRSSRRVNEPLLVLLVETRLGAVRLVHELALMPEPVASAPAVTAEAEMPRDPQPGGMPVVPAPALPETPQAAEPAPAPLTAGQRRYGPVADGDTLRAIAERVRPEPKYGIRRVMTALLLANPDGFDAGRQPRVGGYLIVPSPRQMLDLSAETITATVGPRAGAAARSTPPTPTATPPPLAPPTGPRAAEAVTADGHAGLRLSLRLSAASREVLAGPDSGSEQAPEGDAVPSIAEPAGDPGFEPESDRGREDAAAEGVADPAASAPTDRDEAPVDVEEGANDGTAMARSTSLWWWFLPMACAALAFGWWRYRTPPPSPSAGPIPPPAQPSAQPQAQPRTQPPSPADRPAPRREPDGKKDPAVTAVQQRIDRLAAKPGVSQRTLTVVSAYVDVGDLAMAGRLLDELESGSPQG